MVFYDVWLHQCNLRVVNHLRFRFLYVIVLWRPQSSNIVRLLLPLTATVSAGSRLAQVGRSEPSVMHVRCVRSNLSLWQIVQCLRRAKTVR